MLVAAAWHVVYDGALNLEALQVQPFPSLSEMGASSDAWLAARNASRAASNAVMACSWLASSAWGESSASATSWCRARS